MTLTPKENSLLKDLCSQEKLCIEKYTKYSGDACDGQLKNLFTRLGQNETQHLQTLNQISTGTAPQLGGSTGQSEPSFQPSCCSQADKQKDAFLCADALAMEKHVSAEYNTCIFEFAQPELRTALNHIQSEEQRHGEQLYSYMSVNGMYQAQ